MKAAVEILDRGYGRPAAPQEISGKDGGPIETRNVTPMEAARLILATLADAREVAAIEEKSE